MSRTELGTFDTRNEKKREVNWPELVTYCGCCTLSTGIFIRLIISLVATLIFIVINGMVLGHILKLKSTIGGNNKVVQDEILGLNLTYIKNEPTKYQYNLDLTVLFYIFWLTYKLIYVVALLFTLPVFFKGCHKTLKVLLYVSIPNWILDIFLLFLAIITLNYSHILGFPLLVGLLYDGYNILAISSEYKRMTGKLKPRYKDIEGDVRNQPLTQFSSIPREDFQYIGHHCRTCKCYEPVQLVQPIANLEDVAQETSTRCIRPNTLDLNLNTNDDEKIVVTDEPVIYDVNQLNIGTSLVIEDKQL